MNLSVALGFLTGALLMLLASSIRGDLTKKQTIKNGFLGSHSCLSHTGVWGDVLLIPWLAGIIFTYHDGWGFGDWFWLGLITTLTTMLFHAIWARAGILDHNIAKKDHLTVAGWLHFIFMSAMLTLVALFYFATEDISNDHMFWVSLLLGAHVTLSTMVLEWKRMGKPTLMGVSTTVVVWSILGWRYFSL